MTTPTTTSTPRPAGGGGRVALAVTAGLVAIVAGALLLGGLALLVINGTQRDADGFFTTHEVDLATPGHALVSGDVDLGAEPGDWFPADLAATVRFDVSSADGAPVFVGIGPSDAVDTYLRGVAHAEITEIGPDAADVTYRSVAGGETPGLPGAQDLWVAATQGEGAQRLTWDLERGEWTVVVMNADAADGIFVTATAGVSTDIIVPIGLGLLAGGAVLGAIAGVLIYLVVRRPVPPSAVQGTLATRSTREEVSVR